MKRLGSSMTADASGIIAPTPRGGPGPGSGGAGHPGHERNPIAPPDRLDQPADHPAVGPFIGEQHDLLALADAKALIEKRVEAAVALIHSPVLHGPVIHGPAHPSACPARASAANVAYTFVASWMSPTDRCSSGQYTGGPPGPKITVGTFSPKLAVSPSQFSVTSLGSPPRTWRTASTMSRTTSSPGRAR